MSMLEGMCPADFDLPPQFKAWRPIQEEAIEQAVYGERRFQALALPTGSGKSLTVMSTAKITGKRTVILTGTKGLMDQYLREFAVDHRAKQVFRQMGIQSPVSRSGLVDMRGKANYHCQDHRHTDCENGPRIGCRMCGTLKCPYYEALMQARSAPIVVTNYAYWLHAMKGKGNGLVHAAHEGPVMPIEMLVLDEAHLAPEELSKFLAVRVYEKEVQDLLYCACPQSDSMPEWVEFAREWHKSAELDWKDRADKLKKKGAAASRAEVEAVRKLESLVDRLAKIKAIGTGGGGSMAEWTCEEQKGTRMGRRWEFDPVWPGMYAERALFAGIPKVLLVSATLRPKTLNLLGVGKGEWEFREWDRVFPGNRCPVYHVPAVRLNWKTEKNPQTMAEWVKVIDSIIESRLDRKGIIHTQSYERAEYLMRHSRFKQYMVGNTADPDSPKAAEIVHAFKQAPAPCILVSPSFSTGWDFPGEECEWQIVAKLPFPHTQSKVMQARKARDPLYPDYLCMQTLVQAAGRGMRAEKDRCETLIVDDGIGWFMSRNRGLAPAWFNVRKMAAIPKPPKPLREEWRQMGVVSVGEED